MSALISDADVAGGRLLNRVRWYGREGYRRLYRIYSANGELLYIGQSKDVPRRLVQHRSAGWLGKYPGYIVKVGEFVPAHLALELEREAILNEEPARNVRHNDAVACRLAVERMLEAYPELRSHRAALFGKPVDEKRAAA